MNIKKNYSIGSLSGQVSGIYDPGGLLEIDEGGGNVWYRIVVEVQITAPQITDKTVYEECATIGYKRERAKVW